MQGNNCITLFIVGKTANLVKLVLLTNKEKKLNNYFIFAISLFIRRFDYEEH